MGDFVRQMNLTDDGGQVSLRVPIRKMEPDRLEADGQERQEGFGTDIARFG